MTDDRIDPQEREAMEAAYEDAEGYPWTNEDDICADATRNIAEVVWRAAREYSKQREETLRAQAWCESWQCARLGPDGALLPDSEVREALSFAGFADNVIDAALAQNRSSDD
jgi:hypothetical protein